MITQNGNFNSSDLRTYLATSASAAAELLQPEIGVNLWRLCQASGVRTSDVGISGVVFPISNFEIRNKRFEIASAPVFETMAEADDPFFKERKRQPC